MTALQLTQSNNDQVVEAYDTPAINDQPNIRGIMRGAIIAVGATLFLFSVWAVSLPMSGGVVASGEIVVETNRRAVQAHNAGTIEHLHVREGSKVQAGDVVVSFEPAHAKANHSVIDAQYLRALARHARLIAEVSNAPSITWPSEISERSHEPLVRQLKSFETDLLLADRDFMAGRREILEARIQELGNLSDAFRARIQGLTKQVALFEDEEKDVAQLVKSGFERRPRMLQLQRELAEKQGELDSDRATLLGLKEEAQGAKQELANLAYERRSEVFSQMLEAESSVAELVDRRRSAFSVLKNTEVLAPESGTVVDIRFFGAGGVVRPGEVLFDLVPTPDALLVKAKVRPEDIDVVYVGQEAAVRLLAHQLRMPEPFDGRVTLISADRLTDATDQNPHFEVFVEINKVAAKASQGVALQPGMSADVVLTTQQRTFLEYLVSPITRALFRGFREP